jgi:hypothetical protein
MNNERIVMSSDMAKAWNGHVWHEIINWDTDKTRCGAAVDGEWFFGMPQKELSEYLHNYCKKCFPDAFTVVVGQRVHRERTT